MDSNEMPEKIRERIRQMIKEAVGKSAELNPDLLHVVTSLMYYMYTKGYEDAFRMMEASIKIQKEMLTK